MRVANSISLETCSVVGGLTSVSRFKSTAQVKGVRLRLQATVNIGLQQCVHRNKVSVSIAGVTFWVMHSSLSKGRL
jgi:hypothetical protein